MLIRSNRDSSALHDASDVDHDTTTNVHQDVNVTAAPTFVGLNFDTVASLPAAATTGKIIHLITDNRLYYGKLAP